MVFIVTQILRKEIKYNYMFKKFKITIKIFFMKFLFITIIFSIYLYSCKNNYNYTFLDNICNYNIHLKEDSIKKTTTYARKASNNYLSLSDINNNSDTFFLRIEYSPDTVERIFEFAYCKSQSEYKVYNFLYEQPYNMKMKFDNKKDKLNDFVKIYKSKTIDEKFMSELEKSSLLNLSWSADISGYNNDTSGHIYEIQYSNKCVYKYYFFDSPFENSNKFIEAKQFADFLTYLKKEFNF
jgi:hypothetical protein